MRWKWKYALLFHGESSQSRNRTSALSFAFEYASSKIFSYPLWVSYVKITIIIFMIEYMVVYLNLSKMYECFSKNKNIYMIQFKTASYNSWLLLSDVFKVLDNKFAYGVNEVFSSLEYDIHQSLSKLLLKVRGIMGRKVHHWESKTKISNETQGFY